MREWPKPGEKFESDRDPYALFHPGWGLNPQCRWKSIALYGEAPERNGATSHCFPDNFLFSIGPNSQGGCKRNPRSHHDVPMRDCTIELDGTIVIEEGQLINPKMIVPEVQRV